MHALCQCENVEIICCDMLHFDFESVTPTDTTTNHQTAAREETDNRLIDATQQIRNTSTSTSTSSVASTIVLYMYEPLWTLNKQQAHEIYSTILQTAQK